MYSITQPTYPAFFFFFFAPSLLLRVPPCELGLTKKKKKSKSYSRPRPSILDWSSLIAWLWWGPNKKKKSGVRT